MGDNRQLLQEEELEFLLNETEVSDGDDPNPELLPGDGEVTMRGDLDKIELADIFQTLAMSKMEGQLRVRNLVEQHELFFRDGYVRALSPKRREIMRIGQRLMQAGLITIEQLRSALLIQKRQKDRHLGEILVAEGFVEQDEIDDIFHNQVQEDLFALFTWPSGSFEFYRGPCNDAKMMSRLERCPRFEVNGVLLEVARRGDEWERVIDTIGDLDEIVEVDPDVEPEQPFSDEYATVIASINGERNVRALADHSALGLFLCGCVVRDLIRAGFLKVVSTDTGLAIADAQCERGDLKLATVTYNMIRKRSDSHPITVATRIADGLRRCGDNRAAARVLVESARGESDPIEALRIARMARKCSGRSSEVLAFLRDQLERTGADPQELLDVTSDLADALVQDNETEAALEAVRELERLAPGSPVALNKKAKILAKLGSTDEAVEALLELASHLQGPQQKERLIATYEQVLKFDGRRKDIARALKVLRTSKAAARLRTAGIAAAGLGLLVWAWSIYQAGVAHDRLLALRDEALESVEGGDFEAARTAMAKAMADGAAPQLFAEVAGALRTHDAHRQAERKSELEAECAVILGRADRAIADARLLDAFDLYVSLTHHGKSRLEVDEMIKHRLTAIVTKLQELVAELERNLPPRPNLLQSFEERQQLVEAARAKFLATDRKLAAAVLDEKVLETIDIQLERTEREALAASAKQIERLFARCDEILGEHERELDRTMTAQRLTPLYEAARRHEDAHEFSKALDAYRRLSREHPEEDDLKANFRERVERYATIQRFMHALERATERGDFATAQGQLRALEQAYPDVPFADLAKLPVQVVTIPTGANVFVDGIEAGRAPTLTSYYPGREVKVRVELDGFRVEHTAFTGDRVSTVRSVLAREPCWTFDVGATVEVAATSDDDATVFVTDREGRVTAIDSKKGQRRWQHRTDDMSGLLPRPVIGPANSLVIASVDGKLRTLDRRTGAERWKVPGLPTDLAPACAADTIVVATTDRRLVGIAIADGTKTFEITVDQDIRGELLPILGRTVLVTTTDGKVRAVQLPGGDVRWTVELREPVFTSPCSNGTRAAWLTDNGSLTVYDLESGKPIWTRNGFVGAELAPTCDERWLWIANDRIVTRVDWETGRDAAQLETQHRVVAPPLSHGDNVYVAREDGAFEVVGRDDLETRYLLRHRVQSRAGATPLPDGVRIVTVFLDGSVQCFEPAPLQPSPR